MSIGKIVKNSILLLMASILVGAVLVTIANYIPVRDSIRETSLLQLESEGVFPEVTSLQGEYGDFHSEKPTTLELATDALILKMALYEGDGEGIEQAFRCYSTQFETEYSRYWHGYVVILRALFMLFDYHEIRILNGVCQLVLFMWTAYLISMKKGVKYAFAFATSYFLLMPLALIYCLQYSWIYYVAFLAVLLYIKYGDFWEKDNRYIYLFLMVGVAAIYFDLWTYPLLTWGLVAVWMVILQEEKDTLTHIKKVVFSAIAWIAGYAVMWIGKWIVGSLVLRENLFKRAIEEIFVWTGDSILTVQDRFNAISLNINTYSYKLYMIVLLMWFAYGIARVYRRGTVKNTKVWSLLLIAVSSPAWYFALADHVTMHHIFTHRIFVVSIAAFLGMLLLSTETQNDCKTDKKEKLIYAIIFVFTGVLAVVLMIQIKDTFDRHNGGLTFATRPLEEPAVMTFIPEYAEVTHIQIGVCTEDSTTGAYRVRLYDGDQVLEEETLAIDGTQGDNFHLMEVDWKLKPDKSYEMQVDMVDADGTAVVYVTENELMGIPEYGMVSIGTENVHGQMLVGVTYNCILQDNAKRMLFTVIWWAFGLMMAYAVWSVYPFRKRIK